MAEQNAHNLVEAVELAKVFSTRAGPVNAVDGVSLTIRRGETLGLVGESGSGKSTVARLIMGLQELTAGQVLFDGSDITRMSKAELRTLRRRMQMVFQNPFGSLLPHYTVAANIAEPLRLHGEKDKDVRRARAAELLEQVGLDANAADLYPRQFSGGQQQRIAIARALALKPDLLVCDEPTSSLDVSVQAQILELLEALQTEMNLTALFISHNLAVVQRLASTVAVMCRGRVVEYGPTAAMFDSPQHPYTQVLLAATLPVHSDTPRIEAPPSALAWKASSLDTVKTDLREYAPGHLVRVEV